MICANCGTHNPAGSAHCFNCGSDMNTAARVLDSLDSRKVTPEIVKVPENLHLLHPPEATQTRECSPISFSIAGVTAVPIFTSPEISSGRSGTSAKPCGNFLDSSW